MADIVRELAVLLGFEVDDESFDAAEKSLEVLAKVATGVAAVVTGVAVSMVTLAKTTADYGDELLHTASKLNISTTALQELRYATSLANVSNDQLETSLRKLQQAQGDALLGNKDLTATFAALGVSQEELRGMSIDELFQRVGTSLAEMSDEAKQAAYAANILGEKGIAQDLIPFLRQGSDEIARLRMEAHELGLVMGEDAVKAADEFNDAWDQVTMTTMGLARAIGGDLLPDGIRLLRWIRDVIVANRVLIRVEVKRFFDLFAAAVGVAWTVVDHLLVPLGKLIIGLGGLRAAATAAGIAVSLLAVASLGLAIGKITAMGSALVGFIRLVQLGGGSILRMFSVLALAPMLVGLKWILLAGIIALVWDEIYKTIQGGDTWINRARAMLEKPINPSDNPIVVALKKAYEWARMLNEALAEIAIKLGMAEGEKNDRALWKDFVDPLRIFTGPGNITRRHPEDATGPMGAGAGSGRATGPFLPTMGAGAGSRMGDVAPRLPPPTFWEKWKPGGLMDQGVGWAPSAINIDIDASGYTGDLGALGRTVATSTQAGVTGALDAEKRKAAASIESSIIR